LHNYSYSTLNFGIDDAYEEIWFLSAIREREAMDTSP